MPAKDLISKQLLKRLLEDFGTQLFELDIVDAEMLSNEQPRVEGKRADLVARVKNAQGESYILHVEIQNDNKADVPLRMLRYYSDLALEHIGEEIKQYLLYIGKAPLSIPDHMQATGWRYCYNLLDMRSLDSERFLTSDNPDALVLAILCNLKGQPAKAVVSHIVQELCRLHGSKLDSLRDSLLMLDILASNRDLQNLVKESAEMFIDVEKLGLYQLALEKATKQVMAEGIERGMERGRVEGRVEGIEQGQQTMVLRLLAKFPPDQVADISGFPLDKVNAIAAANKSR